MISNKNMHKPRSKDNFINVFSFNYEPSNAIDNIITIINVKTLYVHSICNPRIHDSPLYLYHIYNGKTRSLRQVFIKLDPLLEFPNSSGASSGNYNY